MKTFMSDEYWMSNADAVGNSSKGIIFPIIIPKMFKKNILKQVELLGITEKIIYPGLDGIGRFIKQKYSWKG